MKRVVILLFAASLIFTAAACANNGQPASGDPTVGHNQMEDKYAPAPPAGDEERELLHIFRDGQALNEGSYAYTDIRDSMAGRKIDGIYYYGASIADITGEDLSNVNGAFLEAVDGYVSYISNINDLYLSAYSAQSGEYQSVVLDNRHVYGGAAAGSSFNKGVVNVYLVSTPVDFTVEIQRNGKEIGQLTMDDFMRKTQVEEDRVATGMFDGSFLHQGGAATYEGRFLGIDYNTMLAKLTGMDMDLSGTITEVEYYGINGLGKEGKNMEYSKSDGDSKYFGSVDFFCMFDGMTYNDITTDCPVGLTAFINGTGGRWMTYNLTTVNFVIE